MYADSVPGLPKSEHNECPNNIIITFVLGYEAIMWSTCASQPNLDHLASDKVCAYLSNFPIIIR